MVVVVTVVDAGGKVVTVVVPGADEVVVVGVVVVDPVMLGPQPASRIKPPIAGTHLRMSGTTMADPRSFRCVLVSVTR